MRIHNIATLTMNPALDLSAEVEKIEPIHKLRCEAGRRDPGGGGINVARVVRRLGGEVSAIFPIGGAIGALLESLLRVEGVHGVPVRIAGETREDFTVFEHASGRQYRFVMPGPELSADETDSCLKALGLADKHPEIVVASGSLPPGVPPEFYASLVAAAKRGGAKTLVDTSGPALRAALRAGVWLVKPNLRELTELAGKPLPDEVAQLAVARKLVTDGSAEIVALSLAEKGARLITRDRTWTACTPPIAPLSTVGAGDSFVGALTWAIARGEDLSEALRYAVAAVLLAGVVGLAAGFAMPKPSNVWCRRSSSKRSEPKLFCQDDGAHQHGDMAFAPERQQHP